MIRTFASLFFLFNLFTGAFVVFLMDWWFLTPDHATVGPISLFSTNDQSYFAIKTSMLNTVGVRTTPDHILPLVQFSSEPAIVSESVENFQFDYYRPSGRQFLEADIPMAKGDSMEIEYEFQQSSTKARRSRDFMRLRMITDDRLQYQSNGLDLNGRQLIKVEAPGDFGSFTCRVVFEGYLGSEVHAKIRVRRVRNVYRFSSVLHECHSVEKCVLPTSAIKDHSINVLVDSRHDNSDITSITFGAEEMPIYPAGRLHWYINIPLGLLAIGYCILVFLAGEYFVEDLISFWSRLGRRDQQTNTVAYEVNEKTIKSSRMF